MDKETYESLKAIVDYLHHDEQKHWEEHEKPKDHIFTAVQKVAEWVDEVAKDYTDEAINTCIFCMSGEPHWHK